jgi:hypothetical protein
MGMAPWQPAHFCARIGATLHGSAPLLLWAAGAPAAPVPAVAAELPATVPAAGLGVTTGTCGASGTTGLAAIGCMAPGLPAAPSGCPEPADPAVSGVQLTAASMSSVLAEADSKCPIREREAG